MGVEETFSAFCRSLPLRAWQRPWGHMGKWFCVRLCASSFIGMFFCLSQQRRLMNEKAKRIVFTSTVIVVGLYFLFLGLSKAQGFLAPVVVAVLLALLMVPVSRKLEKWGIKRGWAAFVCDVILIAFFAGLFLVVSLQVRNAADQWPQMKKKIQPKIEQLQDYISRHTNFSKEEQEKKLNKALPGGSSSQPSSSSEQEQQQSGDHSGGGQGSSSGMKSVAKGVGSAVLAFIGFLGTSLLTFVYIFFFLLYRRQFRKAILNFAPEDKRQKTDDVLGGIGDVAQNYLFGKFILIIFLAVIYGVGLSISGVQQAILISILAAVLSLIPYIGNIIGFVLALALGLFSGGSSGVVLGIVITFAVAQFIESYILEPYIVGERVKLHPVFTIIAVILGEHVWGVVGMVVGIPLLAVVKVISDHVPVLHPLSYALGEHKRGDKQNEKNIFMKVKRKFLRD